MMWKNTRQGLLIKAKKAVWETPVLTDGAKELLLYGLMTSYGSGAEKQFEEFLGVLDEAIFEQKPSKPEDWDQTTDNFGPRLFSLGLTFAFWLQSANERKAALIDRMAEKARRDHQ
jgi:hypothetical protein